MKNKGHLFALLALSWLLFSCSQEKNTFVHRGYHNMNARFNGYFNAKEEFKKGIDKIETGHVENYREMLPLFVHGDDEAAKSVQTEMDIAIKKCSRVIQYHSMDIKGKEYCKWIDECWMLIGRSYFYEKKWNDCRPIFEYVAKKYKKNPSRYEARVWLVKTLLEQENWDRADVVLRTLKNDEDKIPQQLFPYYKAVEADYFIRLGDYPRAIISLEDAILLEKKKDTRTRYLFVLAQLYREQGETIRATGAFKLVAKNHPDYEMEFWAQMYRAFSYNSDDGSAYDIKKVLLKMLRDDKNKEYRDKLYYAMSRIYRQEGREDKQITALKLSAKTSVQDDYQKGLSFLTLGQLYFNKPEYILAQANYDSAVVYLPKDYPDRSHIEGIQESLKDLVEQILIIAEEDSLQKLSKLPEEELMAYLEEVVEEERAEEERRKEQESYASAAGQSSGPDFASSFESGPGKGKWYMYNEKAVKLGLAEFRKTWGDRANQDDWRRSDQSSSAPGSFEDGFAEGSGEIEQEQESVEDVVNRYLEGIPRDDDAISASNARKADAYYKLGNIYRENMSDDLRAIGAFRGLVYEVDTSKHHLTTYYLLYRMYLDEGRIDSSNYFKNIVLYKFPDSDYAKIIEDPDYALNMGKEKKAIQYHYKKAYYYYNNGYYKACIDKVDECLKKYPKNFLEVKLDYLKALSQGAQGDKKALIASLNQFKGKHSGTPEAADAAKRIEILNAVKKDKPKRELPAYTFDKNARHLIVMLVPLAGNKIDDIKLSIARYNNAYQAGKKINLTDVLLDSETNMLSIKQFKNMAEAKSYYAGFLSNRTVLKKVNEKEFPFLIISYTNYALFFKDKRIEVYEDFMREHYEL